MHHLWGFGWLWMCDVHLVDVGLQLFLARCCCVIRGETQPGGKFTKVCLCEAFVMCSQALFHCHTERESSGLQENKETILCLCCSPALLISISRRQKEYT